MTVVGLLLVASGAWLMYYAVRTKSAGTPGKGPIAHAKSELATLTKKAR